MFRPLKTIVLFALLSSVSLCCCKSKPLPVLTFSAHSNALQNALVICDGNSITWGAPVGPKVAYPQLLTRDSFFMESGVTFLNKGVGGQTWGDMLRDVETDIDTHYTLGVKNIVIAWEGTNELYRGSKTPEAAYQLAYAYYNGRRAKGDIVIAATMPHAEPAKNPTPAGDSTAVYVSKTKAYNELVRNNWQSFADGFMDLEKVFPKYDTTYYQSDKVHLKPLGNKILAEQASAALKQL